MTGPILIAYATKRGSTREVADAVAATLYEQGLQPEVHPAAEVEDLNGYGGVVVGGSLYMGRWHPDAVGLMRRYRRVLAGLPVAVFALGPRTLDVSDVAQSEAQLRRALLKVPEVHPFSIGVFGGVVEPAKLPFPLSRMPASDARDWDEIETWARETAAGFGYGKPASDRRDPRRQLQQTHR